MPASHPPLLSRPGARRPGQWWRATRGSLRFLRETFQRRLCRWPPEARLCLSPHGGEPGLLVARQAGRPVVVPQLDEAGGSHLAAPGVEIEEAAVATAAEAFLVVPPRIRAEQDALRPQGAGELA